jgi:hypothetical protein
MLFTQELFIGTALVTIDVLTPTVGIRIYHIAVAPGGGVVRIKIRI